jgi:hypothetical protein
VLLQWGGEQNEGEQIGRTLALRSSRSNNPGTRHLRFFLSHQARPLPLSSSSLHRW